VARCVIAVSGVLLLLLPCQVCLLETSRGQVWAGSHDSAVYVVDNRDVIACTDTLFAHTDKVVAMTTIAGNRYQLSRSRFPCYVILDIV